MDVELKLFGVMINAKSVAKGNAQLETLIDKLYEETKGLKDAYLTKTREYAEAAIEQAKERRSWSEADWCKFLGIEPEERSGHLTFPDGFYNTRYARVLANAQQEVRERLAPKFLDKEMNRAEDHYEASIFKLADRLLKKGLDVDNLEMSTTMMGPNIDTVITDGKKTLHAYTIIAGGPIQRPHYRYLIK